MRDLDYAILADVHPLLSATVLRAAVLYREHHRMAVRVTEGYRSPERQRKLVAEGKSRVLTGMHQRGLAVDLAICRLDGSACTWAFRDYEALNLMMRSAFRDLHRPDGCTLLWGGNWRSLRDGVHWELDGINSPPALVLSLEAPADSASGSAGADAREPRATAREGGKKAPPPIE